MYRKGNNYSFLMWQADLTKVSDVHYTYQSSPSTEQGENMAKGLQITIRTGTLLKNYHHYHNGEITLIHCHLTVEQVMKANLRTPSPIPPLFPGSTSLPNSLPSLLKQQWGIMYGYCSQFIVFCLTFLLTLFPRSSMESHPP